MFCSSLFKTIIIGTLVLVPVTFYLLKPAPSVWEESIRRDFKHHLKPLPPVPYLEILGRVPKREEIELGRMLFNDPVLSRNNDVSCATCHLSNHGFADGNGLTVGTLGQGGPNGNNVGRTFAKGSLSINRNFGDDGSGFQGTSRMFRNSLSTINVAFRHNNDNSEGLFHDGRFGNIFFQALLPIHTSIEMCGENPVPLKNNPFRPGGPFFKKPVSLTHVNIFDPFEGRDLGSFNGTPIDIYGVPTFRPTRTLSIPGRNECLAIALAKLRLIPEYRTLFQKAFQTDQITDQLIGVALGIFMLTHVSKNTPYDRFVRGESSLKQKQLEGLASFFTPLGETYKVGKKTVLGAGCFKCHSPPFFGGFGFISLGVTSDPFSPLTRPQDVVKRQGSFFGRRKLQRGTIPACHVEDITISQDGRAPDLGRADGSFKSEDCFKFRIPVLRNIIETYPYFHHGTARAQGFHSNDLRERSLMALRQVIKYHLQGPVNPKLYSLNKSSTRVFYDRTRQKDYLIPYFRQNFVSLDPEDKQHQQVLNLFPTVINNDDNNDSNLDSLLSFVAEGLFDPKATQRGDLNNDVSHPKRVPSGFYPSITRDHGNQHEHPPNAHF